MALRPTYDALIRTLNAYGATGAPDDPKARTRARILKAAASLFEKHGYRRVSIDQVAREAGIAKGTIYVHFKSKAELLLHTIMEEKKRLVARFEPLFSERMKPSERVRRYLELMLEALEESPLSRRLMTGDRDLVLFLEELPAQIRAELLSQQSAGVERMLEGLGGLDALPAADRQARLRTFQAFLYTLGHLAEARAQTGLPLSTYAHHLATIVVKGLGAR